MRMIAMQSMQEQNENWKKYHKMSRKVDEVKQTLEKFEKVRPFSEEQRRLIKRSEIPNDLAEFLGSTNGEIINTLVRDVIFNSYQKSKICFSKAVSDQLLRLKKFNYEHIYHNDKLKKNHHKIELGFNLLFDHFLRELKQENLNSRIFIHFLKYKDKPYLDVTNDAEKIRDYIAGMTDRYFLEVLQEIILPEMRI